MASLMNRLIPFAGSSCFRRSWTSPSMVIFRRTSIWTNPVVNTVSYCGSVDPSD